MNSTKILGLSVTKVRGKKSRIGVPHNPDREAQERAYITGAYIRQRDYAWHQRQNLSASEKALVFACRGMNLNYTVKSVLRGYIVDLFLKDYKIALEVKSYWHRQPSNKAAVKSRLDNLAAAGYKVVWFDDWRLLRDGEGYVKRTLARNKIKPVAQNK